MLEWLKTSSGAYNLTFIVAIVSWLISGIAIFAGFHLNKVKTIEAESKAKKAEIGQAETASKLEDANARTAELEKKLAPRNLSHEQRSKFIAALAAAPKGPVTITYISPQLESAAFVEQIRSLVTEAGFTVPDTPVYALGYAIPAPPPWFMAVVAVPGTQPPYAVPIVHAFKDIGIDAVGTNGSKIAKPGELQIFVGSK